MLRDARHLSRGSANLAKHEIHSLSIGKDDQYSLICSPTGLYSVEWKMIWGAPDNVGTFEVRSRYWPETARLSMDAVFNHVRLPWRFFSGSIGFKGFGHWQLSVIFIHLFTDSFRLRWRYNTRAGGNWIFLAASGACSKEVWDLKKEHQVFSPIGDC